ncbi:MAG: hypothetical protein H7Y89_08505 [Steroidobacteraceae bacterium]|nr:hypothetical protein [Steroidobacteraceae bacterium]
MSVPGVDKSDLRGLGASLKARYLLDGKVARREDELHLSLELFDSGSGERLWSMDQSRKVSDLTALIGDAVRGVAGRLHARVDASLTSPASIPTHLEAYGIYVRAQELMENQRVADTESALELFRRATVLDPGFARAYLGLAQAHVLSARLSGKDEAATSETIREARTALDRALELDSSLGEALIERARLTDEAVEAEKLFREGLRLAPNYGVGHMRYAEFLIDEYRRGEAIEAMDRARAIDPLKPRLHVRQALFRMVASSDVAAHDALIREALAINPKLVLGLLQLGNSRHQYSGEFADGIRLLEQAIRLDPNSDALKIEVASMYLDVDDPVAALAVLAECEGAPNSMVEVAQYRRESKRAAELARAVHLDDWRTMWAVPEATALRDEAIATSSFALALERQAERYAITIPRGSRKTGGPRAWNRGVGLVYAHTLVAAGETQRGRKLALTILAQLDSESVGRAQHFLSRDKAAALRILGDDDRALEELKNSLGIGHYYSWWYLGELDPLYETLRADPRFQALVTQAKQHRVRQRSLLEELRRTEQVVKR